MALVFGAGLTLAQVDVAEAVNLDENIQPEDLGIGEPRLLPDNPFYFLKNWVRGIQSVLTFNPVKKAELRMKFANEKLMEVKKLVELKKNPEIIKKATENYQQETEKIKNQVEKIKEKVKENSQVESFLDKFIHQQILHQKLLQKLETQVPAEAFEKIKEARERHLERFKDVMLKLEDRKEKITEKLDKILEEQKGSQFKEFKNLEVLKNLEEKVPEEAKEAIQKAQENALKRLQGDLEKMSPEDQERFKDYLEKISGNILKHLDIIEGLKGEELSEDLGEIIEEAEEKNIEKIEKTEIKKEGIEAQIKKAEDSLKAAEKLIAEKNLKIEEVPAVYRLVKEATEKLEIAKKAFEEGEYGRAFGQSVASECLSRNAIRIIEIRLGFKKIIEEGKPICSDIQKPVCGENGKIYQNICLAKQAGVKISYFGECQELPCAKEGEKVNRNPLLGPTIQVCCEGLEEIRMSRSYSICQKEDFVSECEEDEDCPLPRCPGLKSKCVRGECVIPHCPSPIICIQVITPAKNPLTGECQEFPTPCDVPEGWEKVDKCPEELTCEEKCNSLEYSSGICRSWAVSPAAEWGCRSNEISVGETSDCYIPKHKGMPLVGIGRTCCCQTCLQEGKTYMPGEDKQCCPSLEKMPITSGDGIICTLPMGYVCTAFCGDGKCEGEYENPCSCPKDCK